ncbi:hypothetical protein WICPIJ_004817, partial [Wickerhamomyces pijperi]
MPSRPSVVDSPTSPSEEAPPPMPSRPRSGTQSSRRSVVSDAYADSMESDRNGGVQDPDDFVKDG